MARAATCNRCNETIKKGGGYAFYCSSEISLGETRGFALLCETCTSEVIRPSNWEFKNEDAYLTEMAAYDAVQDQKKRSPDEAKANLKWVLQAIRHAMDVSIALHCMAQDFSPAQAKAKGREFAERWWRDPVAGEAEAVAFWKSSAKERADAALQPSFVRRHGCLIGCVGVSALLALMCVGAGAIGIFMMESEKRDVRAEATSILRLIGDGKTADAYVATALEYRAESNEAAFAETVKGLDIAGYVEWQETNIKNNRSPKKGWTLEGYATGPGARVTPLTMEFINENGTWRLRSIQRPPAGK